MSHDAFELGLHDLDNAGVYAVGTDDIAPLAAAARDAGLRVSRIDLHAVCNKRTLLARMAAQLDFPAGTGGNWDALLDNLRDLGWLKANGHALFLDQADSLRACAAGDFDTLLTVLDEASQFWAERQTPFWAFIALDQVP